MMPNKYIASIEIMMIVTMLPRSNKLDLGNVYNEPGQKEQKIVLMIMQLI